MFIQKDDYKPGKSDRAMSFSELYEEISRGRDDKAARLQERRWHKLNNQPG